jgi:hypothetical protein
MSHTPIHHIYLKIGIIALILLWFLRLWHWYLGESETIVPAENTNATTYMSAQSVNYGIIWVALSTRVGIAYQNGQGQSRSANFYKEITSIGETPEEKKAIRSEMIAQNMLIMQEYLNLSRTDIKTLLDSSTDRKSTLEWFISQLEMRYINSALSLQSLEKQKIQLLTYLWEVETEIEVVKSSMETNFSAALASKTLTNVDRYFILRAEYTQSFTDIVFINQFIKQHVFLNNYNKGILDTLINNKDAIINKSYVVIPDSWDQYLRPLELIFDEAEMKK